jgi:hypothetical protein
MKQAIDNKRFWCGVLVLTWLFAIVLPARSEGAQDIVTEAQGVVIPPHLVEGTTVQSVYIHLINSEGVAPGEDELKAAIAQSFVLSAGDRFTIVMAEQGVRQVLTMPTVLTAEYRVYESAEAGSVIIAVLATIGLSEEKPVQKRGWLYNRDWRALPVLYESSRAKVSGYVYGGMGVFSDFNPWFSQTAAFTQGSPVAEDPASGHNATWGELDVEPGLYGMAQIADSPFFFYGDVSFMLTIAEGQDLFVSGSRSYADIEKGYVGLLYAKPSAGKKIVFNLSGGRQPFQLNDGFIISRYSGSSNAGERASLYLNARTAFENTALASLQIGNAHLQGFFLEPQEIDLPAAQTDAQIAGIQLSYDDEKHINSGLSLLGVPQSRATYVMPDRQRLNREGLRVINPHLYLRRLNGWWLKTEYAYEDHEDYDMRAQAAYAVIGHQFEKAAWKPNMSYRYAYFSGDNPKTDTYERFDPLLSGGLAEWVNGITLKKVVSNTNMTVQRLRFSVNPTSTLELQFDYFYLRAVEENNLGGAAPLQTLSSKDLGHEIMMTTRWQINRNLFLLGVLSHAIPGEAIRDLSGPVDNWSSCQVALFFNF